MSLKIKDGKTEDELAQIMRLLKCSGLCIINLTIYLVYFESYEYTYKYLRPFLWIITKKLSCKAYIRPCIIQRYKIVVNSKIMCSLNIFSPPKFLSQFYVFSLLNTQHTGSPIFFRVKERSDSEFYERFLNRVIVYYADILSVACAI